MAKAAGPKKTPLARDKHGKTIGVR